MNRVRGEQAESRIARRVRSDWLQLRLRRRRIMAGPWPLRLLAAVVLMLILCVLAVLRHPPRSLLPAGVSTPVDRANQVAAFRTALIQLTVAVGASVALIFTARTYQLTRRGQVTDRFNKALERLGATELYVRLGGVRALEQIMNDSMDHHGDAVEVLVEFVRHWCDPRRQVRSDRPPADVQAALAVLSRQLHDGAANELFFAALTLNGARLDRAYLREANFAGAGLITAELRYATLTGAIMTGADLSGAFLSYATLGAVQLQNANLQGATLTGAYLAGALLEGADLTGADLTDVEFCRRVGLLEALGSSVLSFFGTAPPQLRIETDLSEVRGLSLEQLEAAKLDANVTLPPGFSWNSGSRRVVKEALGEPRTDGVRERTHRGADRAQRAQRPAKAAARKRAGSASSAHRP